MKLLLWIILLLLALRQYEKRAFSVILLYQWTNGQGNVFSLMLSFRSFCVHVAVYIVVYGQSRTGWLVRYYERWEIFNVKEGHCETVSKCILHLSVSCMKQPGDGEILSEHAS